MILHNFLRVLVSYQVFSAGGVAFHSAAVVSNNFAHLFLGHSGDGKSTLSTLSIAEGKAVFSDDFNALIPSEGIYEVVPVPLSGAYGGQYDPTLKAPLKAIYRLAKGDALKVDPATPASIFSKAISNTPFLNCDPLRMPALLDRMQLIFSSVPTRTLQFTRGPGIWAKITEADESPHD